MTDEKKSVSVVLPLHVYQKFGFGPNSNRTTAGYIRQVLICHLRCLDAGISYPPGLFRLSRC